MMLDFSFDAIMPKEIYVKQNGIAYRFAWCEHCGNHSEQKKVEDGWECTCGHVNKEQG